MSDRSAGGNICKPRIDRLAHVKFVHHVFPRRVIGKPLYGITRAWAFAFNDSVTVPSDAEDMTESSRG